jgi:hypothetical protein
MPAVQDERLLTTLKRTAAALRDAGVPFALAGGMAAWARGGPPTEKDIDVFVREQDADAALRALTAVGMTTEIPPEGWLVKAFDDGVLVDVIFRPSGVEVDDTLLCACDVMQVSAVEMRVLPVDDLLTSKLLALSEHVLDLGPVLEISRALREQVNWLAVRKRTRSSPFARAFFALLDELDIVQGGVAGDDDGGAR